MNSAKELSRRGFLKNSSSLIALSVLGPLTNMSVAKSPENRVRVVLVGTGSRGTGMWGKNLIKDYANQIQMVGVCDINPKRAEYGSSVIGREGGYAIPWYVDFDRMLKETKPDKVIIATMDSVHEEYVVRAMQLEYDVICEKPLGVTAEQCQNIYNAQKKYNRAVDVTFNFRYYPFAEKVKDLIMAQEIGDIYQVIYQEFLGLSHGSSYFRRWHAYKKFSGTLLCTKACHHFDVVNWWLQAEPEEVYAYGALNKYGSKGPYRHIQCRKCPHSKECSFYWDITKDKVCMEMYANCESEDGYLRDACVYRSDIDTYDTASVLVKYNNGVELNYTLTACAPYEGQLIVLQGSKGRIVARLGSQPWKEEDSDISLSRNRGESNIYVMREEDGGHGGADPKLKNHLFQIQTSDRFQQKADARAGIMSSMIGVAAYTSIERGQPVRIDELFHF